jgi:hypothetical protein
MKASTLTLALLCAGPALAQTSAPAAPPGAIAHMEPSAAMVAQHMEDLATLLDLTDVQKPQVQAVLTAEHEKMKAQLAQAQAAGSKPDWQQMKALHEQAQQETLKQLAPVLSATQLKKFQIIQQAMHPHHGPGPGGRSGSDAPPQN